MLIYRLGVAVVVCAGLTCGCSVGERGVDSKTTAVNFLAAMADGDKRTACALLATRTREDLVTSEGKPCPAALESVDIAGGEVADVAVWGDRALARTSTGTLFLVELSTGWRVSAAGCTHADEHTYDCRLAA